MYVGNIHTHVTKPLFQEVLSSTGSVEGCKLIRKDKSSYGFVDYYDRRSAAFAILSLNGRQESTTAEDSVQKNRKHQEKDDEDNETDDDDHAGRLKETIEQEMNKLHLVDDNNRNIVSELKEAAIVGDNKKNDDENGVPDSENITEKLGENAVPAEPQSYKKHSKNRMERINNRIQLSNIKKPFFFYLNLARWQLKKNKYVQLSVLGMAIPTAILTTGILRCNVKAIAAAQKQAKEATKETSYPFDPGIMQGFFEKLESLRSSVLQRHRKLVVNNACGSDDNGSVNGFPIKPNRLFMQEAIGAEYGEGFETFRQDGPFKVYVDFLNDKLQEGFLQRIRYAMKPDEAYGLIFSWIGKV